MPQRSKFTITQKRAMRKAKGVAGTVVSDTFLGASGDEEVWLAEMYVPGA